MHVPSRKVARDLPPSTCWPWPTPLAITITTTTASPVPPSRPSWTPPRPAAAPADQRLTAPRRRVLELLLQAGQPVKAYDLIASFAVEGPPAKPPTVYRALDFLEKQGFAHRIESLNSYVACRKEADGHAAAFLICDCCGACPRDRAQGQRRDHRRRAPRATP